MYKMAKLPPEAVEFFNKKPNNIEFTTKYFGKIIIDESDGHGFSFISYNNQNITITFSGCHNKENYKIFLEIIDKYIELHEIAKKVIFCYINKNSESFWLKFKKNIILSAEIKTEEYFKNPLYSRKDVEQLLEQFINNNQQSDAESFVNKLLFPDFLLLFDNNEFSIQLEYKVLRDTLCVIMDKQLKVTRCFWLCDITPLVFE